uniref:Uncharacterized protein n=1 Tax=Arundo donax TaxID=35708 RepID=A0A0A9FV82_ARUDO
MQHTDIIQYKVIVFKLRWDAPGLALSWFYGGMHRGLP